MRTAIVAAAVLSALSPLLARWAAARLPPQRAATLLLATAVVAAAVWVWVVGLAAFVLAGGSPWLGAIGHWSTSVVRHGDPVPWPVSVLAWVAVAVGAVRLATVLRAAHRFVLSARCLPGRNRGDRVTIIRGGPPVAAVIPGLPGRIVLSVSLLARLDPRERRVVMAHERCHLRHGHWLFKVTARTAASVAPCVRVLVEQLDTALERWADEAAATELGDRRITAQAIARAALVAVPVAPGQVGVGTGRTAARVTALLAEPPRRRWTPALVPACALGVAVVLGIEAGEQVDALFDLARSMWVL